MAKSMRSKREKRLRAIRREIVEPFYQKKDEAKLAALEAALAAPKLPVRAPASTSMEVVTPSSTGATSTSPTNNMDVEMEEGIQRKDSLKPIGKKLKKKFKLGKKKRHGKGKIRGKRNL
ncbi:hypothetical protein SLA2020_379570 [Shorea laevis]|uniref:Uncharacterized protein n=1 Tax=Rubroshorea leprosula TaxID=152421 RepID=A0AAV5KJ19_9ROSI|nr:hypothetical protein SLEP1_g34132 [Rubroshorea leprosula]